MLLKAERTDADSLTMQTGSRSVVAEDPAADKVSVLVVEDSPEFQLVLQSVLTSEGFDVQVAGSGEVALERARITMPEVVVLDVVLPGMDGLDVCRELREFSDAYVVMLSGRDEEVDKLVGLAVGADDYMTKPFSPRELAARIRAMLRRPRIAEPADTSVLTVGDMQIDTAGREVVVGGLQVELTKIEFDILAALASRPTMVFARRVLIEHVWGENWVGDDHVIEVHIGNLRKKIDTTTKHIRTVRGVGYRIAS